MPSARRRLFLAGGAATAMLALAVIAVGQTAHSAATASGTPYPTRPGAPASCTPTPAVRPPTFTIGPAEGTIVNIQSTKIVAYQNAYPGDVHAPAHTFDLATATADNQKYAAIVRHANCTYDKYLMVYDQLGGFEQSLPVGDSVVAVLPPAASLGHVPNTAPPLPSGTPSPVVTRQASPVQSIAPPPLSVQQTVGTLLGPIPYDATKASITHTTPAPTP